MSLGPRRFSCSIESLYNSSRRILTDFLPGIPASPFSPRIIAFKICCMSDPSSCDCSLSIRINVSNIFTRRSNGSTCGMDPNNRAIFGSEKAAAKRSLSSSILVGRFRSFSSSSDDSSTSIGSSLKSLEERFITSRCRCWVNVMRSAVVLSMSSSRVIKLSTIVND